MTAPHWSEALVKRGSCAEAVAWCLTQPDPETAWQNCHRADWMIWILRNVGVVADREYRLAACDIAELVIGFVAAEHRPACAEAIATARRFAEGAATMGELQATFSITYAAACVNDASAANAAYSAADFVSAVAAKNTAAYAIYAASAYAAADAERRAQADIIRKYFPHPPEIQ